MEDAEEPDFGGAGLLDGLEDGDRAARLELLRRLHADGCGLEELIAAAQAERLAVLPLERMLSVRQRHSIADAAEATGLSLGYLRRNHATLGLPRVDDDEPVYDDSQIENLHVLKGMLDAGLPADELHEMGRVLGHAGRRSAEALLDRLAGLMIRAGDTERDIAQRYADFAEATLPVVDRMAGAVLRLHLLDVVRREAITRVEREAGRLGGTREIGVAFVDLTGFTALSEAAGFDEVGSVAGRFETLVADAAEAPVRLVKLLGDGAMLVCDEPVPLLDSVLRMRDGASAAGLPPVHAGVAFGAALRSAGDWYGHTVNLAARVCDAAERETVLVTAEVAERAAPRFAFAPAGERTLKGIEEPVPVLRAERRERAQRRV